MLSKDYVLIFLFNFICVSFLTQILQPIFDPILPNELCKKFTIDHGATFKCFSSRISSEGDFEGKKDFYLFVHFEIIHMSQTIPVFYKFYSQFYMATKGNAEAFSGPYVIGSILQW